MKSCKVFFAFVLALVLCLSTSVAMAVSTWDDLATAMTNGGTVTLTGNINSPDGGTLEVPEGKTVVLDLNGHTLSGMKTTDTTANHQLILNNGTLTIKDSSSDKSGLISYTYSGSKTSHAADTIMNNWGATLTVQNGTIQNKTSVSGQITHAIYNITYNSKGDTTLKIEGGSIKGNVSAFSNSSMYTNRIIISDGAIQGSVEMLDASANAKGELTMTGGSITSSSYGIFLSQGTYQNTAGYKFNISGGSISGELGAVFLYGVGEPDENLDVEISGGSFNGHMYILVYTEDMQDAEYLNVISGGDFSVEYIISMLKDGVTYTTSNGRWLVTSPSSAPVCSAPKTGDNSTVALWGSLMAISAAAFVVLGKKARFNQQRSRYIP